MPVLSRYKPLEVGGITFLVTRNYGSVQWAQGRVREANIQDGASGLEAEMRANAACRDILLECVRDWVDVTDEDGAPIPWGPEAVDLIEPEVVIELARQLAGGAEGQAGKGLTSTD